MTNPDSHPPLPKILTGVSIEDEKDYERDLVQAFRVQGHADKTLREYEASFRIFADWCHPRDDCPLPASPDVVQRFIAAEADRGLKVATLKLRLAAIRFVHQQCELPSPTEMGSVKQVMRGIRRTIGTAQISKAPLTIERLMALLEHCECDLVGLRDRALLFIGYAGAFRRSELVDLEVADLQFVDRGVTILVRRSKTDQESRGLRKAVLQGDRHCPVATLKIWLNAAGISEGPVFRRIYKGGRVSDKALSAQSVALIVKKYAKKAELFAGEFAGHSLRSGFVTSAAERDARREKIKAVTGHTSDASLETYTAPIDAYKDHAAEGMY